MESRTTTYTPDPLDAWLIKVNAASDVKTKVIVFDEERYSRTLETDHPDNTINARAKIATKISKVLAVKVFKKDLSDPKETKKIKKLPHITEKFWHLLVTDGLDAWKGNEKQIQCTKALGTGPKGLFLIASQMGLASALEWRHIHTTHQQIQTFKNTVLDEDGNIKDEWIGNENQIRYAQMMGISSLGALYDIAFAFELDKKLGWNDIPTKLDIIQKFKDLVLNEDGTPKDEWKGNQNQIRCAHELGKIHLLKLHRAAFAFGLTKKLKWSYINAPFNGVQTLKDTVLDKDENVKDEWKGNQNQIRYAEEMGISYLGSLNTIASALGLAKELEWTSIRATLKQIKKFQSLVLDENGNIKEHWKGNKGQIWCAEELGEMHLKALCSIALALGLIENLHWTHINAPYKTIKKFKGLVLRKFEDGPIEVNPKYKGNKGQIQCAKNLGRMNLEQLYSIASALDLTEPLEWIVIPTTYEKTVAFRLIIAELVHKGEIEQYCNYSGRLVFTIIYGYTLQSTLPLSEIFDFQDILNWRIHGRKSFKTNSTRAISYEDNPEGKRSLAETLPDQHQNIFNEVYERQIIRLVLNLKNNHKSAETLKELKNILRITDEMLEAITKRILEMSIDEILEIFGKETE